MTRNLGAERKRGEQSRGYAVSTARAGATGGEERDQARGNTPDRQASQAAREAWALASLLRREAQDAALSAERSRQSLERIERTALASLWRRHVQRLAREGWEGRRAQQGEPHVTPKEAKTILTAKLAAALTQFQRTNPTATEELAAQVVSAKVVRSLDRDVLEALLLQEAEKIAVAVEVRADATHRAPEDLLSPPSTGDA